MFFKGKGLIKRKRLIKKEESIKSKKQFDKEGRVVSKEIERKKEEFD